MTTFGWMLAQVGLMGEGWQDVVILDIWQKAFATSFGQVWRWELILSIILLFSCFVKSVKTTQYLILILSIIILGLHALIGHAAMQSGFYGIFHRINQFIHLIAAAYWFGGLWPFLIYLQLQRHKDSLLSLDNKVQIMKSMQRFSYYGHIAVALVIITGVINAMTILPDWTRMNFGSVYQSLLWFKIICVGVMVLLALINRYFILPKIKQAGRLNQFITNVMIELILGSLAIFAVTIFATFEPV